MTSSDYVPLIPYNGTGPNGGDSLTQNLSLYYQVRLYTLELPEQTLMQSLEWRYCVDDHINSSGVADDSRSGVSTTCS